MTEILAFLAGFLLGAAVVAHRWRASRMRLADQIDRLHREKMDVLRTLPPPADGRTPRRPPVPPRRHTRR